MVSCEVHDVLLHSEHNDEFTAYAYFLPTGLHQYLTLLLDSRGFYRVNDFELMYSGDQSIVLDPLTDDDRRTSVTLNSNSWLMFSVPNEAYFVSFFCHYLEKRKSIHILLRWQKQALHVRLLGVLRGVNWEGHGLPWTLERIQVISETVELNDSSFHISKHLILCIVSLLFSR